MLPFSDTDQQNICSLQNMESNLFLLQDENHNISSDGNNKTNNENNDQFNIVPSSTNWDISSPCILYFCCCFKSYFNCCNCCNEFISPCVTVKGKHGERTFWGFLELDLCGPSFALFLVILAYLTFFSTVMTFVKTSETSSFFNFLLIETLFLLFMFLWSFFSSACSDPGFLPFDWKSHQNFTSHHQHQNEYIIIPKVGWRTQLSGLAVNQEQIDYAKNHSLSYASFSRSAGRFVVRADHICGWTGNWVGKRNHKQFILMTFWGSLMMINLFFWQFKYARMKITDKDGSKRFRFLFSLGPIGFFVQIAAVIFEPILLILFLVEFAQSFVNVIRNTTKIKNWKNKNKNMNKVNDDYGFWKSLKEICGNSSVFCWIFPFPAFGNDLILSDEEMIGESPLIY